MEYLVNLNHKLVSSVSWLPESIGAVRRGSIPGQTNTHDLLNNWGESDDWFDICKWLDPLVFLAKNIKQ